VDTFLAGLDLDPLAQFGRWLDEARAAGLPEPESAALATADATGAPSVRMVLVRQHDARGLVFFTNRESRKALELAANPRAALALLWALPLQRQVRAEGAVELLDDDGSASYFRTRPRASQIGAWASPQSREVADRDALDALVAAVEERFANVDEIPLPPFWGGYRLVPHALELWQGRPGRLHDRARYVRDGSTWRRVRLAP
jgi:pyridoxamine 5'-phosphate oxidase